VFLIFPLHKEGCPSGSWLSLIRHACGVPPSPRGRLPSGLFVCGGSGCPECEARRNTLGVPPPYCKTVALFCGTVKTVPYGAVAERADNIRPYGGLKALTFRFQFIKIPRVAEQSIVETRS